MKKDILDEYMSREGVSSSSLKVFYTFTSGENDVVWNDLYTKEEHYCDSHLLADKFPGLSIGYTDTPSHLISGSGYFTSNDMLRIGSGIVDQDWTVFLDFGASGCSVDNQVKNTAENIICSMDNPAATSGFNMGLNNTNKLFVEYNNLGQNVSHTLDKELSKFNVVSLSYSSFLNEFSFSYHDFPNGINESKSFEATNYAHSNIWHLGGMNNPSNLYTGFSGSMDDFLFFDKNIDEGTRDTLAEAFFVEEIIPASVTYTTGTQILPVGVSINPTGILGTEVTGYDCLPAITVEQKVGSDIDLYAIDSLTGAITGNVVEFVTSGTGSIPQAVIVPEEIIYNTGELLTHSKDYILFSEKPTADDIYEFYLFQNPKPNLNKPTNFLATRGQNELAPTYSRGANINLYLNGLAQISGDTYSVSDFNIVTNGYHSVSDYVSYDKIQGSTFTSGFAGTSSDYNLVSGELIDEDIYLNGQKLISGQNYSINGSTITLLSGLPEGELSFMAQAKNITSIITGSSSEKVATNSVDEQVWLNGVRQKENEDYFRVNECTVFSPDKKMKKQQNSIYNNNGEFFNI